MNHLALLCFLTVISPIMLPIRSTTYAQPAPPDKAKVKQAKAYVDAGLAAQGGGDYDTAITFYTKAYELVPHPVLLFNIAQSHRLAGHVDQAVKLYQSFLATNPTGAEAQLARDLLAEIAKRKSEHARRVEQATKARKAGRFEEARVELEAAYALDPQPDLLYALSQVYAKLGNCGEASTYYKRFVATQKSSRSTDVVDQEIAACKPTPPPAKGPPQSPEGPRPLPDKQPSYPNGPIQSPAGQPSRSAVDKPALLPAVARQGSPWYKDGIGDALVLGGVAASVGALVVYRSALSDLDTAERDALTLTDYYGLVDRAHSRRTTSVAIGTVGSILIVTGIVRYVLHYNSTDTTVDKSAMPSDDAPHGSPWYKDKLGDALVLGGVAASVVALVVYRRAFSDLDVAEHDARDLQNYNYYVDRAHSKRTTSAMIGGVGSALIVTGIVRYVLHYNSTDTRAIGVAPSHGGGVATYGGTF